MIWGEPARSAVVLAGGLGTRMGTLTKDQPKHLLEVAGAPLLSHQLRWLASHGVRDVVLATSYLASRFEPALGDGSRWGLRLRYVSEEVPLGTGGGLALASRAIDVPSRAYVIVVNGDLITDHNLTSQMALTSSANRQAPHAVLHLRTVPDARAYGCVVADDDGRARQFVEKSHAPPTQEINAGTYVLRRSVIDAIPSGVVSLERDVLPALVAGGRVIAYREQAMWEDIGNPAALVRASSMLVERSGRRAHIDSTASVHPSVRLGSGSAIGPRAVIDSGAVVEGSIVMADALVGAHAKLADSVVGSGATVAPGAIVTGDVAN